MLSISFWHEKHSTILTPVVTGAN